MSAKRKCSNSPDVFCYVCQKFTLAKDRRKITGKVGKSYLRYFGVKIGFRVNRGHPPWFAKVAKSSLYVGKMAQQTLKFGVPMIRREPTNCINDCYFCMVKTVGFNAENKHLIKYPKIRSAIHPVTHSLKVPTQSTSFTSENMDQHMEFDVHLPFDNQTKTILEPSPSLSTSNQAELNDLARNLGLSKVNSELLASRLKEKNALAPGINITFFRTREQELLACFDRN